MTSDVDYLLSLRSIRERAKIVGEAAQAGKLVHFDVHDEKMGEVADFVTSVVKRDFGPDRFDSIPPHGRWQHFEVGGVPRLAELTKSWEDGGSDKVEITRRLIDLFFVSVLLDAGAGDHWRYVETASDGTKREYERSEGIAVASLYMFNSQLFSSDKERKIPEVNGKGLQGLENHALGEGFQVSNKNPMLGVDTRADLLRGLGKSLLHNSTIFGEVGRPGNLVDFMIKSAGESSDLDILKLWNTLQELLIPIWPKDRTVVGGRPLGDAWPLKVLQNQTTSTSASSDHIQPFHKLTQWLTYSLMVPFERVLGLKWKNAQSLTALPEYRNGGLFVDLGVLSLKPASLERGQKDSGGELPQFEAGDDVVVEWRAMTLVLIDKLYEMVLSRLDGAHLTMAQLLEAGTWKSGREIAAKHRPETKSSPIIIKSDGTVF